MEKIKILGIAPYQEMEPLMRDIAKSYDNLELYTFTGFYKNAIQFAKAFPDKEFDVIVSRGGTADLVRSLNDTPVVKIKVSTLDLLRVITQALQCSSRAAVVSYSYITDRVEMLAKFLRLDIRTFSFETPEQIEDTVKQCARAGYDLIVGGAATRDYAVAEGAQFLLITSSRESVEASIQQAIEQHHLINDVLDKNRLFQSVIDVRLRRIHLRGTAELQYTKCSGAKMLNDVERMEQFLSWGSPRCRMAGTLHLIKKLNNDFCVRSRAVFFRSARRSAISLRYTSAPLAIGYPPSPSWRTRRTSARRRACRLPASCICAQWTSSSRLPAVPRCPF